jgi:hypothetical protein
MLTRRRAAGALLVATFWCSVPVAAAASTPWGVAIVATDPVTHEVGATGAECAPEDAAAMASILPGRGAGVTLPTDPAASDRLLASLSTHGAADVLTSTRQRTSAASRRVFAVATLGEVGATWVGRRVLGGGEWVGPGAAEVTVGVAPEVLTRGAHALGRHAGLAERLLGALEATAAGHACSGRPSAAFLIVSEAGETPLVPARGLAAARARQRGVLKHLSGQLAADELEDRLLGAGSIPHPSGPHAAKVYVSLLASPEGFSAVTLLHQAYDQITAGSPTAAPPASAPSPAHDRSSGSDGHVIVIGLLVIGAIAAVLGISRRLRRLDEDQKGSPAS